jgi:hypothetical protein
MGRFKFTDILKMRSTRPSRRERAVAAAIISCAALLCMFWSIRVPMFQEPDEVAHADASFLYFDAGRAFAVADATTGDFVVPQTRYLMGVADYRRLRYDSRAAVPKGYGTRAYFRAADARAPYPTGSVPQVGQAIPYVLAFYPSTYYCEVAVAMRAGWTMLGHSLSAAFFAGRIVNVAMFSCMLIIAYRIYVELSFSASQRLLLLSGIAFFPLSTWMGAYIQPDNQSALLIAASLLACITLRKHPESLPRLIFFGAAVSALGITKLQYALVVVAACGLTLRNAFDVKPMATKVRAVAIGLVLPLLAAVGGHYLSPIGTLQTLSGSSEYAHIGVIGFAQSAASHVRDDIADAFLGGRAFGGFWFRFGIRGFGAYAGASARGVTGLIIALTASAFLAWFASLLRFARRLRRVAERHGLRRTARFLGADPTLNLYVLSTTMLFAINAFTGGDLALQGRYWYPVLIPIVILSVRSIGAAFPSALRVRATSVACAFWCAYSVLSAPAAVVAMQHSFYHGGDERPAYAIGRVESVTVDGRPADLQNITIPAGSTVTVRGDALDTSIGLPAADVRYRIDESIERPTRTRLPDAMLAAYFNDQLLDRAGFRFDLRSSEIGAGSHEVTISVHEAHDTETLPIATIGVSVVVPSTHRSDAIAGVTR